MRYFDRGAMQRPAVLDSARFREAREKIERYLRESDERLQRQRRAPVEPGLINHPEIKSALEEGFGGVCAYCEGDMRAFQFFDIEHHRPKFGAEDPKKRTDPLYYVWLTFEWDNLLPVCRMCNSAKRNKFFVAGERGPIGASVAKLRMVEKALLLDPCHDDVSEHLGFDASGVARGKTERGRVTIEVLTLNRLPLVEARRRELAQLRLMLASRVPLAALRTGLAAGWGASILAGEDGAPLRHAGAMTLALLHQASEMMGELEDIEEFLAEWPLLPPKERKRFLAALAPGEPAAGASPDIPDAVQQPVSPRPGRIVRIDAIASAERPICEVHIRNFKALASVDLILPPVADNPELAPCMMLLGENATGKSSVLEAIALALLGTREVEALDTLVAADEIRPAEYVHRPDTSDWDVTSKEPLAVDVRFLGLRDRAVITGGAGEAFGGTAHTSKIVLGYGPRRYFPRHSTRRFRAPAHRIRSLFDPMATIANPIGWLRDLRHRDVGKFDAAVRALRIILMLRDDAKIEVEGDRIMIETDQGQTPLTKLSVGYKSVLAMAIDIIRELFAHYDNLENAYAVVLVDEIETHLHPRWKLQIVGLLRQAFPKVQFLLTTHDPLCLRGMYQGEVFVLRRNEEGNSIEMLDDLPDIRGMRAEQILTSEFFGLGSTDPSTDAKVERYQYLTVQAERSDEEEAERLRLVEEIEVQMMVGLTIGQQTDAEAVRLADLDAPISLSPVRDGERRRMVAEALAKLAGA